MLPSSSSFQGGNYPLLCEGWRRGGGGGVETASFGPLRNDRFSREEEEETPIHKQKITSSKAIEKLSALKNSFKKKIVKF